MTNPAHSESAVAYVLAQTQENIKFLRSVQQISADDASQILSKLSSAPTLRMSTPPRLNNELSTFSMPIPGLDKLSISSNPSPKPSSLARPPPPIPSTVLFKVRAIWGYNEDGNDREDLQFYKGDVIDIIDNSNAEWWKGRVRGKEGLFPSSYVEGISSPPENSAMIPSSGLPGHGNMYSPSYQYPQQPQQNGYYGPPQGNQYPLNNLGPQGPPPPQAAPVVVANAAEPKKHGFLQGKLGNTLAQSAVGGVGFGAGSAIGGGIINAIF